MTESCGFEMIYSKDTDREKMLTLQQKIVKLKNSIDQEKTDVNTNADSFPHFIAFAST